MKSFPIILLFAVLLAACSSTKEEVKQPEPVPEKPKTEIAPAMEARPLYKYTDRFYVPGASISEETQTDDPLQALRVIQLRKGINEVLVISSFDKSTIDGVETPMETWLGLEMKTFAPGKYDVSKAIKAQFYRFVLSNKGKRFVGEKFSGTIEIRTNKEDELTGFLNMTIKGRSEGFEQATNDFQSSFSGAFSVKRVALENTRIGK